MDEKAIKLECIKIATSISNDDSSKIIPFAQKLWEFIQGESAQKT